MRILQGHRWGIRAVAFHPTDPTLLVSAGDDHLVRVWNLATGECQEREGHRQGILRLLFTTRNQWLFSAGRDGLLLAWDLALPLWARRTRIPHRPIRCLTPAPDAAVFVLDSQPLASDVPGHGRLHVWQSSFTDSVPCRWLAGPIDQAASTPDGKILAIARPDRYLLLWFEDHSCTELMPQPFPQSISTLAFAPSLGCRDLAVASGPRVYLFDWQACQQRTVCRGHKGAINALAFSPDGRTLLTGSADRSARLWDVATGQLRAAWRWDLGPIWSVALSADGMLAAAGGEKNTLLVWDLDGV